jgi:hypothetical protein
VGAETVIDLLTQTCQAENEYGYSCTLDDRHGPVHLCECAVEWYVDEFGETQWVQ